MNADELYDQIKDALHHFNLKWNQKDLIEVRVISGKIVFLHDRNSVTYGKGD